MSDQAEHLRNLVRTAPAAGAKPRAAGGTPLVVVTGCKAGVGATTVAVNVGVVLANRGARVLVVDAAGERSNMMEIAGVRSSGEFTFADALAGKCGVADVVIAGPGGTKLLATRGRVSPRREIESSPRRIFDRRDSSTWHKELQAALKSLRGAFDVMVIDAGAGLSRTARRLWLRAQLALLVTTSDDAAVMDAYAATKLHVVGARDATCENIRVLVNQAENDRAAADALRRLTNCCQRFLRQSVAALPALPWFGEDEGASAGMHPRVWEAPNSEFGHAVMWLGRAIGDVLEANVPTVRDEARGKRNASGASRTLPQAPSTARDEATLDSDWGRKA